MMSEGVDVSFNSPIRGIGVGGFQADIWGCLWRVEPSAV